MHPLVALLSLTARAGTFEGEAAVGLQSTALSAEHELYDPTRWHQAVSPTAGLAGRFGYYPLGFLGVEADLQLGSGLTAETNDPVLLQTLGGQLVAGPWIGDPRATWQPFVGVGLDQMTQRSSALGRDADGAFHVGAGLKYKYGERAKVRVDLRDAMSGRFGPSPKPAHHLSVAVSFAWRVGPPPRRPPRSSFWSCSAPTRTPPPAKSSPRSPPRTSSPPRSSTSPTTPTSPRAAAAAP